MTRLAPLLVLVVLLGSACSGGGKSDLYAGLSEYDAGSAARDAMAQERADPESELFDKELVVDGVSKGTRDDGGQAWVATFTDFENHPFGICLWIWSGGRSPFRESYVYDIGPCRAPGAT